MLRHYGLLLCLLILSGCTSMPEELRPVNERALLSFTDAALIQPPAEARWGGEIAAVRNRSGDTEIEVVQFELGTSGRPLKSDTSAGRFRIRVAGFIDPAIYAPGRQVTALGSFTGIEQGNVGEQSYAFPVLKVDSVHLWPVIQDPPERCDCGPFFHTPFMMRPIIVVPQN